MNMKYPLALLKSIALIGLMSSCTSNDSDHADTQSTTVHDEARKPNVVYVLTDQWRAQATGYSGDPNLIGRTPNLDQIANSGINFRNAVSTTPVCTPYRAALLTGQYPTTTGMIFNDLHLPEESYTMAEMFKESGYTTAYIGKWHLDGMMRDQFTPPERRQGFEYWKALECSHEYNELFYYEGDDPQKKQWEGYGPYAETDDAISYIKQYADGGKPFLMVLSLGAPHFPHNSAPEETQKLFSPEDIVLRGNVTAQQAESARNEAAGYYAHIAALDTSIGKLHAAIAEAGISDNTIFVFTSDHGEMMGSHGWRPKQKQVAWAESVKVPFLLKYPARYGNEKIAVDAPINTPDILPTLLAMAGLPIAKSIEGENMTHAIGDNDAAKNKAALIMNVSPFAGDFDEYRGVYTSRYAYVETLDGPSMLFDMKNDPLQLDNLVNKPEHQELQRKLELSLQRELEKVGDEFMPRQYYIDKWNYKLNESGHIPYGFLKDFEAAEPGEIVFQGPGLNKPKKNK
ncbi:MAG: sulfatase [Gammaproteobacteria bacterium]|nr:MAG: sulfatase [Gammaproteobacteria bacterium]